MLTDDQQRRLVALHTDARERRAAADRAWQALHREVAAVYDAGQDDMPPTSLAQIGAALGVTSQQAGRWRKKAVGG